MAVPKEFMEMVCADIQRITDSWRVSTEEKLKLHRELDGRYQACIKNWYVGFWGSNSAGTHIRYSFLEDLPTSIGENLDMMKAKLETYRFQMNAVSSEVPAQQINVTTNVNISITFEEVRSKIEDMTALSREQTDEILEKINELEEISKEKSSRKTKWDKVKPIIAFALDKGADVAMAILSLVMQMKLGM